MSGFQSPNYTQTPNNLFDELLPDMELAELKVVLCIVRHTFGYHRENEGVKLSIRNIARFTGLTARSVMKGAEQAEAHGLLERQQDGNQTTIWRAIVSVIPSSTRRNTKYHATVLPSSTLVGVKEKRNINKAAGATIYTLYENEIGMLTPLIADALKDAEKNYATQWIYDAVAEAVKNNKRNWKYIEAILKRWKQEGRGSLKAKSNGAGVTVIPIKTPLMEFEEKRRAAKEKQT